MKILYLTFTSSPYRCDFFNELGKYVTLDVWFEYKKDPSGTRDDSWENDKAQNYTAYYDINFSKMKSYDIVVICGISTKIEMQALMYLKMHRIKYILEVDGGVPKKDNLIKNFLKRFFISGASRYFSTGETSDSYLIHYGAKPERIVRYHFTSLFEKDIYSFDEISTLRKKYREELGLGDGFYAIYVGRFVKIKRVDTFLSALGKLPKDINALLIGGELTEEYSQIIEKNNLKNVSTINFLSSSELKKYYLSADVLVLPTMLEIWGLVLNEAFSCGLPAITTNTCVAGLELIKDKGTGFLFNAGDVDALAECILKMYQLTQDQKNEMSKGCIDIIRNYTIETMTNDHYEAFRQFLK